MKKIFAFSKADGSFVVSAVDETGIEERLESIKNKYPEFYKRFIAPGIKLVKEKNLGEAVKKVRKLA